MKHPQHDLLIAAVKEKDEQLAQFEIDYKKLLADQTMKFNMIMEAHTKIKRLEDALKTIYEMDYTRSATNGYGFDAHNIAKKALGE